MPAGKKNGTSPKKSKQKALSVEEQRRDYAERLAELAAELRASAGRALAEAQSALPTVTGVTPGRIGSEEVTQFVHRGKAFAIGYTDTMFPGTNGARGIRKVHLYDAGKIVLGAVGEFTSHSFGASFKCVDLKVYHAGPWEDHFQALTDGLRTFRADRKEEVRLSRARAYGRRS